MDSIAICSLLFGIMFIQFVVSIDADKINLNQLEKMVADLKVGHDILSQKISEIQFENNFFKTSIKEFRVENEQLKERIHDLEDENRTQKKFNNQLKMEKAIIKPLLKSSEFEELLTIKSSLLQTDKSKIVVETDSLLRDDYKSVKSIGTDSLKPGTIHSGAALNNVGKTSSKRLLLIGSFCSFNNVSFYITYPLMFLLINWLII